MTGEVVGVSATAIFGDLGGYAFRNFRDKASNISYGNMLYPLSACNYCLQNELPRMILSGYFMSKSVLGQHFLVQSV